MAMNFFEHQAQARKRTGRLVLIFIAGVLALIASTYFIGLVIAMMSGGGDLGGDPLVHAGLFAVSAFVSLLIVGIGWVVKRSQLGAGGRAVAESLGGRVIEPNTSDPGERRVINIVEEMAIASGVPVPPVYLVPDDSINAFAAGYRPEQAVIGVTRGALQAFNREQLEGVIAHEYSHILNGDMRLNIRLVSAVFGLACLSLVGSVIVRSLAHGSRGARFSSRGRGKGGGGIAAILIAGVGLIIIGWVGRLFGQLMQAAVSRQREFLADASAVQFTRNPAGISGALRTIAASGRNRMEQPAAAEFSHMFFSNALESFFATHPPLPERISRIERRPVEDVAAELAAGQIAPIVSREAMDDARSAQSAAPASAFAGGRGGEAGDGVGGGAAGSESSRAAAAPLVRDYSTPTRSRAEVRQTAESIGRVEPEAIDYARAVRARIPTAILAAAHEPFDARALVAALLLSSDASIRAAQLAILARPELGRLAEITERLAPAVAQLPRDLKLPLVDMCVPSLRRLSRPQAMEILDAVRALIAADERLDLFEWALRAVLRRGFEPVAAPGGGGASLALFLPAMAQLLATLAWGGARSEPDASASFMAGYIAAGVPAPPLPPRDECTLDRLDEAVKNLARLRATDRDRVIAAAVECVACDEVVTISEAEILRATIALLGAPMPPVLPTATER